MTGDLDAIVDDRTITAAIVLTPPAAHRPLVERLAAAGKHVLLEKPLAATPGDAEAVVAACRRAGVVLAVVFQHRYRPAAQALAAQLRAGALGRAGERVGVDTLVAAAGLLRRARARHTRP